MENHKIPTVKEFLGNYNCPSMKFCKVCMNFEQDLQKMLIEFAKLHVEAALKEAALVSSKTDNPKYILDAYPLENIK